MSNDQMTTENASTSREAAQKALEAAQVEQTAAREALTQAQAAQRAATVAVSNAKSLVMEADARVLLAKATLSRLGGAAPVANRNGASDQSKVQQTVAAILRDAGPEGLSLDEIYARLQAAGVQMAGADPRKNLSAYIARWSKVAGSGIKGLVRGRYGFDGPTTFPEVPTFLAPVRMPDEAPVEVPAFLAPAEEVPAQALPEDFPGREALVEAGICSVEDLTGKTHDQLRRIKGVGAGTAREILARLEA